MTIRKTSMRIIVAVAFACLLSVSQGSGTIPWPPGCPNTCFLQGLELRVSSALDLVRQSELKEIKWKSDCCCKNRRQSLYIGARDYAQSSLAVLEYPIATSYSQGQKKTVRALKAQDCSIASFGQDYAEIRKLLGNIMSSIRSLRANGGRNAEVCETRKASIDDALEDYTTRVQELLDHLDACSKSACDPQASSTVLPPCENRELSVWVFENGKSENVQSIYFFAQAQPDAECGDCCWAQQANIATSLEYYRLSYRSLFASYVIAEDHSETGKKYIDTVPLKYIYQQDPVIEEDISYACLAATMGSSGSLLETLGDLLCAQRSCGASILDYISPLDRAYQINISYLVAYGQSLKCNF